jgi:cell division protein ZapE
MTSDPIIGAPRLIDRVPTITGPEIAAELVPPRQFEYASFESYQTDSTFPSQKEALQSLTAFSQTGAQSRSGRFFSHRKTRPAEMQPGIYLDGGFGVGKTHLLAALWHRASGRKYFGTFIEYTALVGALGYASAVELLRGAEIICIDEFELDDPGDTMIMTRLLSELVTTGSRVAATSNTPPTALGEGRFAAVDFLREIQALSAHFRTIRIDGNDYRHRGINGQARMMEQSHVLQSITQHVENGDSVTFDDFDDVVHYLATVHPSRYIKIIEGLTAIAWKNVHEVTNQNDALRLVAFIDRVYDAQIPLLASGFPLEHVFSTEMLNGGYRKKYLRAISRLIALTHESP